jgi:hypothetical protein
VETIEDRRLWGFQRIEQDREHFSVTGTFAKSIVLKSTPTNAEIYLDGSDRPVGVTGFTNRLLLTLGTHTVSLQKKDYLPKNFTLQLEESSPDEYHETLSRVVKILARDAAGASDRDLGATVLQLVSENNTTRVRATTPCEFTLQPSKYTVLLRKDGYRDLQLVIPPTGTVVIGRMERSQVTLEILVLDEAGGEPVQNAQVRYRSLAAESRELSAGDTDEAGIAAKNLAPGEYRFSVKKNGYREATQDFSVTANGKNQLVIKMQAL